MKSEETLTRDKTSQTSQQCPQPSSPPESSAAPVEVPPIAAVKTERLLEVAPTLERPIKTEPEEDDKTAKDGGSLGIKIVECWSLQRVKEEPVDAPPVSQAPLPRAAEGGVAEMAKVKQEADTDEWQSGGLKRPSTPSKQLQEDAGVAHKKFRPHQQPLQDEGEEGAWPVKVEKDPTSHDEGEGEREITGPPCGALSRAVAMETLHAATLYLSRRHKTVVFHSRLWCRSHVPLCSLRAQEGGD